jgi:hypothetical protein
VFLWLSGVNKSGELINKFTARVKAPAEFEDEPVTLECLCNHLNNLKSTPDDTSLLANLLRDYDIDVTTMKFYSKLPIADVKHLSHETPLASFDRQPRSMPLFYTLPEGKSK